MNNLHDSVERWLVQDGHSVIETKTEDNFKIIIKILMHLVTIWKFLSLNSRPMY